MENKVYNGGTQSYCGEDNPIRVTNERHSKDNLYMAIAYEKPVIGRRYFCYRLEFVNSQAKFTYWYTSKIEEIKKIGRNTYIVTTINSTYIVNVG